MPSQIQIRGVKIEFNTEAIAPKAMMQIAATVSCKIAIVATAVGIMSVLGVHKIIRVGNITNLSVAGSWGLLMGGFGSLVIIAVFSVVNRRCNSIHPPVQPAPAIEEKDFIKVIRAKPATLSFQKGSREGKVESSDSIPVKEAVVVAEGDTAMTAQQGEMQVVEQGLAEVTVRILSTVAQEEGFEIVDYPLSLHKSLLAFVTEEEKQKIIASLKSKDISLKSKDISHENDFILPMVIARNLIEPYFPFFKNQGLDKSLLHMDINNGGEYLLFFDVTCALIAIMEDKIPLQLKQSKSLEKIKEKCQVLDISPDYLIFRLAKERYSNYAKGALDPSTAAEYIAKKEKELGLKIDQDNEVKTQALIQSIQDVSGDLTGASSEDFKEILDKLNDYIAFASRGLNS